MRKIGTPATSFLLLILSASCFSQPSTPSQDTKADAITSESLLQRAHTMLPALSPWDRMALISQLAGSGGKKHPEVAAAWMDEAFNAASHLSDRQTRINYQILLVQMLSNVDSAAALDKLATIEPPLHPGDDDYRDAGAMSAFDHFYRDHPGDVDRIIAVARHIGDSGTYPFGGLYNVLAQLLVPSVSQERRASADVLLHDAARYLRAAAPSDDVNERFTNLIRRFSKFMPPELLKPALQELVARLIQPPQAQKNRMITMIPDKDDAPPVISHNRNDVLLAELMPAVRSVDTAWEQELRQSAGMNRAAERLESGSALGVLAAYSNRKPSDDEEAIQRLQAQRVIELGLEQPEQALKALGDVSNPVENAAMAAELAWLLKDSRPEDSARLLAQAQKTLENTKSPQERICILQTLVFTLASMRKPEELTVALDQSFAAGDEIMAAAVAERYWESDAASRADTASRAAPDLPRSFSTRPR